MDKKTVYTKLYLVLLALLLSWSSFAQSKNDVATAEEDTTVVPILPTLGVQLKRTNTSLLKSNINKVPMQLVVQQPFTSLQQLLKGNAAGVHIQEPTGEPGAEQNIFIHGISSPLLNKRYLHDQQAAVYVNGIPLLTDNPFAYDIQKYDFNRIGTATNILSILNANNIKSIEVIKDPLTLAALGPLASNGAVWVTTKEGSDFDLSINSYYGVVPAKAVTAVNASYENQFRQKFYDKYGTLNDRLNYPLYLRDSTNNDYYGAANWTDEYYKSTTMYNADFGLSAGMDRANFRFFGHAAKNVNSADATNISKYGANLMINVAPIKWLMISSMISYNKLVRDRNRSVRDRLAEQRYIPDLTNPLTPNKRLYQQYLSRFGETETIDDNVNNALEGYIAVNADLGKLQYNGRVAFDYNESLRDVFWPTQLLEGNNFASSYFGFNQRLITTNTLDYTFDINEKNTLKLGVLQSFNNDNFKYTYMYGYNTPNDFIKSFVVEGDRNKPATYLIPSGEIIHYLPSKMKTSLLSLGGSATWELKDILKVDALVRRDGSSTMPLNHRWYTGFGGGITWDIKNHLMGDADQISTWSLNGAWSRLGKTFSDDRYAAGPQYRVDLGWGNEPTLGTYAGIPGLSRPYTNGWVDYNIPWMYVDKLMIGTRIGFAEDKVKLGIDVYNKDDKNGLFPMPVAAEWGYTSAYQSGLHVNNKGVDVTVDASIVANEAINWNLNANVNYNKNTLKALPGGAAEVVLGSNKLMVGQAVDQFWVLKNEGIYNSLSDIPAGFTIRGVAPKVGDAKWADMNGDNRIDDRDKVLKGNYIPKVTGGFGSSLIWKAITFDFQFHYALGHAALNNYASRRLDFINTESAQHINAVKEITYWERKQDLNSYPVYNPWSTTIPYRADQDLFVDNASFLKLRSVSLGYDFSKVMRNSAFKKSIIYITGTNLVTFTKFKGDDPELVGYNGIYNGDGLPMPRSLILGFRLDF